MSVHVFLNLLNEIGKIDKMKDLPSILSLLAMSAIYSIIHTFNIGVCLSDSFYLIPKLRIELLKMIKLLQTTRPFGL